MMTGTISQYQQPLWGPIDRALRNCLIGAGILGLVTLIVVFVTPILPTKPMTVEDVPDRIARLILEKPKAPAIKAPESVAVAPKAEPHAPPEPAKVEPKPMPKRAVPQPRVAPDQGVRGRQKARQEVAQNVSQVTGSLDKVLESISKSLPATDSKTPAGDSGARRRRGVRAGRTGGQIASVGGVSSLSSADVSGSAIENRGISISAITDLDVQGGGGGSPEGQARGSSPGASSGSNDYRSNESLLSVIRRYAPGIQFCYDNELKRNPGLRGKLVVSLVVLASGAVSEAVIVEDTLKSPAVRECVLAQIRGWQFPAIPAGNTSFKTPFVFTPPS
jgi:outer membrane biosynthesis protein TonB